MVYICCVYLLVGWPNVVAATDDCSNVDSLPNIPDADIELSKKRKFREVSHYDSHSSGGAKKKRKLITRPWTQEESDILVRTAVRTKKDWKKVSSKLVNRTPSQCSQRWNRVLNPKLKKGVWNEVEEKKLIDIVEAKGPFWNIVAKKMKTRSGMH